MAVTNQDVAPRYATALYEAAVEQKQLPGVHDELNQLQDVLQDTPKLLSVLTSHTVAQSEKSTIITTLTKDASALVANLIKMTFDYGRIAALPLIIADFEKTYAEAQGIIEATVTTAVPLQQAQQDTLSKAIAAKFGANSVTLQAKVDPSVLGGVKVVTNDRIIDGTVKTRLAKIQATLLAK